MIENLVRLLEKQPLFDLFMHLGLELLRLPLLCFPGSCISYLFVVRRVVQRIGEFLACILILLLLLTRVEGVN